MTKVTKDLHRYLGKRQKKTIKQHIDTVKCFLKGRKVECENVVYDHNLNPEGFKLNADQTRTIVILDSEPTLIDKIKKLFKKKD